MNRKELVERERLLSSNLTSVEMWKQKLEALVELTTEDTRKKEEMEEQVKIMSQSIAKLRRELDVIVFHLEGCKAKNE